MAELCLECFNKIFKKNKTFEEVYMQYDICENCKQNKLCVIYIINPNLTEGENNEH